jgi:hypothetical protein
MLPVSLSTGDAIRGRFDLMFVQSLILMSDCYIAPDIRKIIPRLHLPAS